MIYSWNSWNLMAKRSDFGVGFGIPGESLEPVHVLWERESLRWWECMIPFFLMQIKTSMFSSIVSFFLYNFFFLKKKFAYL